MDTLLALFLELYTFEERKRWLCRLYNGSTSLAVVSLNNLNFRCFMQSFCHFRSIDLQTRLDRTTVVSRTAEIEGVGEAENPSTAVLEGLTCSYAPIIELKF